MAAHHHQQKGVRLEPQSTSYRQSIPSSPPSIRQPPISPTIPLAEVRTANENWRGKNDPAERRRIQNRLNQRAFRQRQRAGESPKQYRPRTTSASSSQPPDDESDESDDSCDDDEDSDCSSHDDDASAAPSGRSRSSHPAGRPAAAAPAAAAQATSGSRNQNTSNARPIGVTDAQTGQVWDELARIINRNFISAAIANAQQIGLDLPTLQSGAAVTTPRISSTTGPNHTGRPTSSKPIPSTLKAVELQHQIAHDLIIDTIPHARLRFNILRAIATGQVDAAAFSKSIRASGAMEELAGGSWQRGGVVVWNSPDLQACDVASWELSEPFVRRWVFLLAGCEDLIAATNAWRGKRGERLFPSSVA